MLTFDGSKFGKFDLNADWADECRDKLLRDFKDVLIQL